jgi:hypothetical protein
MILLAVNSTIFYHFNAVHALFLDVLTRGAERRGWDAREEINGE